MKIVFDSILNLYKITFVSYFEYVYSGSSLMREYDNKDGRTDFDGFYLFIHTSTYYGIILK